MDQININGIFEIRHDKIFNCKCLTLSKYSRSPFFQAVQTINPTLSERPEEDTYKYIVVPSEASAYWSGKELQCFLSGTWVPSQLVCVKRVQTPEFRSNRQVKIRDALVCRCCFTYPSHSPSDFTSLLTLDWCLCVCVCLHRHGVWIDVCCWLRRKVHCGQVNPAAAGPGRITINNAWKEQIIYNSTERWALLLSSSKSTETCIAQTAAAKIMFWGYRLRKWWQKTVKDILLHSMIVKPVLTLKQKKMLTVLS